MPKAGPDKRLCGAQRLNQPKGALCTQRAGWGTSHPGVGHCKRHGGSTESQTKHAAAEQEAVQVAAIAEVARNLSIPIGDVSEHEALIEDLRRTRRQIAWVEQEIAELQADEIFYGKTYEVTGRDSGHGTGMREGDTTRDHAQIRREARLHIAVVYLSDRQRHLATLAVAMVKLGLEERQTVVNERIGHQFSALVTAILADLGLTKKQQAIAPEVVRRHLRLLGSTA